MFSPLQAQWSHTVSWTVRSCGIPPSPPLKKETLTCGSTRAHHSTCTVLPRSGSRIKRLFCITWSLLDVLKNNYVPFLILYNVSWMNSLTKVYSSIENFWYQHWGFQTSIKFSFHLWKLNIELRLSLFISIVLYMNILYVQYSLTTAITCTWLTVQPFSESLSVSALKLEILIHVLKMSFFFFFFTLMEVAKVVT